ncbi:MAG: DNA repair protein RadC [Flavobacteriaceae bacterium]|nr:DNA repair protein RadC [Flavobacteriaceae bacterium]
MKKKKSFFSIKSWSIEDRPREKLLIKGKNSLSKAELIAILIGSGNKDESAVDLSKRILASVNFSLHELGKLTVKKLTKFKGIGEAKAITIVSALELSRRRRSERALIKKKIVSSRSVFELMQPIIGELFHEEFWVIYLNSSNKVLMKSFLSKGGITSTSVDLRLILKSALQIGAVGLVLAHNHPSGALRPSGADKNITKKIKQAAEILDIKVVDHLIITENSYFSFADKRLL